MDLKQKVEHLIQQALVERPDMYVVDFDISENNDIRIIVDGDKGVTIDDIVWLSRQIEHNLDRDEEDFALTVSSVDITRPFALKRQYHKNLNRNVKIKTEAGEKQGTLVAIDDNHITIEYKVREPKEKGKGKQTVIKQENIAFDDIKEAKVVLKF